MTFLNPAEARDQALRGHKVWAFLWLIRFVTCIIGCLTVVAGFRLSQGSHDLETVVLAVLSTFLVMSAGSAWNDYCDRDADATNLPFRPLPAGILSPRLALGYAVVAFAAGNITAFGLGLKGSLFFALTTAAALAYSPWIKGIPGAKNLYVAGYCVAHLVFAEYLEGIVSRTIAPAIVALVIMAARELLMDIRDIDGDRRVGARTIPIAIGVAPTYWAAGSLFALTAVLELWLLHPLANGAPAFGALLASSACFAGVAASIVPPRDLSPEHLTIRIRVLMTGIVLGIVSLSL